MPAKNIFFRVAAVMSGCVIAFLIAEVAIRVAAPAWLKRKMQEIHSGGASYGFTGDLMWKIDEQDGRFVRFVPFSRFNVQNSEYRNTVQIDEWGGRLTPGKTKPKDSMLVPFIGDSMSFGIGVEDGQTYVSLLNAKSNFKYINISSPGSALMQQLFIIKHRHNELGMPPVYIFNFCMRNDFRGIFDYFSREKSARMGSLKAKNKMKTCLVFFNYYFYNNSILKKSYLLQFAKAILLNIYNKFAYEQLMDSFFFAIDPKNSGFLSEAQRRLEKALMQLERLSEELNFKAIFILVPDRYQIYPHIFKLKAEYYGLKIEDLDVRLLNRILRNRLSTHGFAYIDILDCLRAKGEGLYYTMDDHLTASGNQAAYECIFPELEMMLLSLKNLRHQ